MAASSPMARQAEALAAMGRVPDAIVMLNRGAANRDAHALFTLAIWRLTGRYLTRDLKLCRDYIRRAAEAGREDASSAYIAFVASGIGAKPDWTQASDLLRDFSKKNHEARRQLDLIQQMDLSDHGDPQALAPPKLLSSSPHVELYRSLFTPEECAFLIQAATPLFQPSDVIHPVTGERLLHPVRRSDLAAFPLMAENPAIHALNRRIAAISGTKAEQGEPLQVLRYRPGQEYRPHHDALPGEHNQREVTVLVYLNEDYAGGETVFSSTGLAVRGRVGDALLFRNVTEDGRPDPMAQHAGSPVARGTKLIASRWIRREPLNLGAPRY